jgi:micrococcal nuclease
VIVSLAGAYKAFGSEQDPGSPLASDQARVTRVVDGDTVKVELGDRDETLRLIGIDTPETVDPRRPVGCYGKEASEHTKSLLPNGTVVRLERDAEERDRYGRLLVYVFRASDGLFVNADLAAQGYAQPLTIAPNVTHADEFARLAAHARQLHAGLWGACTDVSENR